MPPHWPKSGGGQKIVPPHFQNRGATPVLKQYLALQRAVNGSTAKRFLHNYILAQDRGKLVTFVADKRRRLLFTGDDDKVVMTRNLSVTRRQQNRISDKSEVRLNLKLTTDERKASRRLSATAELLVISNFLLVLKSF